MKNVFKRKKDAVPKVNVPRTMEEINKAYGEAVARAGQAQYLVFVHSKDLEQINEQLISLNQEAAARANLDKTKAEEATKEGATNE
jgi:hypothetical protein